jgi:hypothetical protein
VCVTYFILMLINGVTGNPRFYDGIKQLAAFFGMLLYILLVISVSKGIYFFPVPMNWHSLEMASVYMWFEVQWCIFVGTIFSNVLFIAIRTCVHHKIKMDHVDEMK